VKTPADAAGVERRFRGGASRWDEIYSEAGNPVARLWDRLTRSNVRRRFELAFDAAGPLAGKSVLDLGCGSGRYLVEAVHRGAARVVGVDFAPEMLSIAGELVRKVPGGERVELVCADVLSLRLDERFDLVIVNGVFDYVRETDALMAQAAGWTRGTLVASFPHRWAPRALPRYAYWRMRGFRIRLFDRGQIERLATRAGFARPQVTRVGPIYVLTARAS
jgi:SAM-dependent methyltransferase